MSTRAAKATNARLRFLRFIEAATALAIASLTVLSCGGSLVKSRSIRELVMVTRGECGNTPVMQANLTSALRALGLPEDYRVINLDVLPRTDVLTGYPTPTLLYRGRDIFGMPEPPPPFPEPA